MTKFDELISQISEKLANRKISIFEDWKRRVRKDQEMESVKYMPETVLEDNILELLEIIIKAVHQSEQNEFAEIAKLSFIHTKNRTKNNYTATEITREYQLLRKSIFESIREDLNELSGRNCQNIVYQIDSILDVAVSRSFDNFLEHKIKNINEIQNSLSNTNKELTRLLEISRDHFSHLAHDLKTPLNSIMGYAQILLHKQQKLEAKENNQDIESLNRVLRSSHQLLEMVNELLEVFQYEKSGVKLRLACFDIRSIINTTIEDLEPLATKKGLEISKHYDNAPQKIVSDITGMQKIITNLLSNAIRYTDIGQIMITAETIAVDKWLLKVEDTGIGIAQEDQDEIFQPFVRTTTGEIRKGSTGLGLAIVDQLVKLLQGEIELVSEPNQGSSFMITFPLEVSE